MMRLGSTGRRRQQWLHDATHMKACLVLSKVSSIDTDTPVSLLVVVVVHYY